MRTRRIGSIDRTGRAGRAGKTLAAGTLLFASALLLAACAKESSRSLPSRTTAAHGTPYAGIVYKLAVGKFENRSGYLQGLFADGADRLGNQSKTILKTHLQQSGRFLVVDRENLAEISREAELRGATPRLEGAEVVITGDVTEFGRRTTGDVQLFGILGAGKKQIAYAKVALNVVDVGTSEIVYSAQGAGEYELGNRQVAGFGGTAGYDATLTGKVLDLAIAEAVDALVAGLERGAWSPRGAR